MAVLAQEIIDRAETTLFDETNERWEQDELLDYLNAGIKAIASTNLDAYVLTEDVFLVTGTAKQEIPDGGKQLVSIQNVVNGGAVRRIDKDHLDHSNPNWYTQTGTPQHYVFDKRNPKVFWVYPVPSASTSISMTYVGVPDDITIGQSIPIDDYFENALHLWVVGYALMKNTKRGDVAKAQAYLSLFSNLVGSEQAAQEAFSPQFGGDS